MECPFELPVEKIITNKMYSNLGGRANEWGIADSYGILFLEDITDEAKADYIVQAINSHEKLVEDSQKTRCPCGGELEGLGYDKKTQEVVFECKKCHSQLLLPNEVWEQALEEPGELK